MMLSYKELESPVGKLKLVANANALVAILWERERPNRIKLAMLKYNPQQPILVEAERQLQEYFAGTRNEFHLPLEPAGTEFQKKVWRALREIPFGQNQELSGFSQEHRLSEGRPRSWRRQWQESVVDHRAVSSRHRREWSTDRLCRRG